ncbi:hypothetical protein QIS74_10818 [Colletotrichum tabaci]|uniref:Uncharacterized protein n=1 Tax=Colletotrichum tabaci TaxID=1209068 RepID=A0AAV9T1K1_9PEZI
MPDTTATLKFLAKSKRYDTEKPYVIVSAASGPEIRDADKTNTESESRDGILLKDVRGREKEFKLEDQGFQVLKHASEFPRLDTIEQCDGYQKETTKLLKNIFGATCKRRVVEYEKGATWNYHDPRETDGPAVMAHVDHTLQSGITVVDMYLSADEKTEYLNGDYRIRLLNIWRPMVPVIKHQPLALCDVRTTRPGQFVACDRILCERLGEVYLMQYHEAQEWYWLENQTPQEPFMFLTWDSESNGQARYCPHLSFKNEYAGANAPPRESVETRSIVITRRGTND